MQLWELRNAHGEINYLLVKLFFWGKRGKAERYDLKTCFGHSNICCWQIFNMDILVVDVHVSFH